MTDFPTIFCKTEEWLLDGEVYLPGWYFWDEAYYLHGPFDTHEETKQLLADYCKNELGEKP